MWTHIPLLRLTACVSLLVTGLVAAAGEHELRYRGEYTYGHEVNIFCPVISSQCYWLSGETPGEIRAALQQSSMKHKTEPYDSVCVVIEGKIDGDSAKEGFAVDYDGLVTVNRLFGLCTESAFVTQGDLQHHRWVLESVNGEALAIDELDGKVPELDFGEQMQVSGNSGCNQIRGVAALRETFFLIEQMISTQRFCAPPQNELELKVQTLLGSESTISLDQQRNLTLAASETVLFFRLEDWVE
jgi:heat shock protein HslJ